MDVIVDYAEGFGVYEDRTFPCQFTGGRGNHIVQMVAAYAMFANGGERVEPTLVDRIQDRHGKTVYRHDQRVCLECGDDQLAAGRSPLIISNRERIMDEITAYQLTSMMEGVVDRGTAAATVNLTWQPRAKRAPRMRRGCLVRWLYIQYRRGLLSI